MQSYIVDKKINGEHIQNVFKIEFPGSHMSQDLIEKYETRIYSFVRKGLLGADWILADNLNIDHATDPADNAWFTYSIEISDEYDTDEELDYFLDWFDHYMYLQ